ncbi:MAG: 2Fe-2S iron-sulfur cluster-binding protein, partial [Sulfuricella sp.]
MRFSIYRYNPETDSKPHMQDYELDIDAGNMMLLDAILLLKAQDETLSVRRSCREGVCGSDAMNINGRNGLACVTPLSGLKQPIELRPLPGLPVVRDLVV